MTIKGISIKSLFLAAIPSFLVLFVAIFFNFFYELVANASLPETRVEAQSLWLYPIVVYILFAALFYACYKTVSNKIEKPNFSESEVLKIIEQWSGIVDGIGTALPLIGAAVILFTVGLGKDHQDLFLNFAVPFEIKSLLILATAKLFESVFDEFEMQIQKLCVKTNGNSDESTLMMNGKIEFVNLPTEYQLDEMNKTIKAWKETVDSMKEPEFNESLNKILKITGK